jgi:L-proline---[L-prolyl-carrier protein] ligase
VIDERIRLDDLLCSSAQRFPDRPALQAGDQTLTYSELDSAADRVAAALQDQGVMPGNRVGIHIDKGPEAIASLYGTMRAGAAYVPVDAGGPAARSAYIATDCEVAALVSTPELIERLRAEDPKAAPAGIAVGSPAPDRFTTWDQVQAAEREPEPRQLVDTDLAYILYTSGSTGQPKGVAISHRNSLTFVRWAHRTMGLLETDVLSSHAPLHFDLSTFDFFAAASAGACVCVVPADAAMFPARLAEWIGERGITVWYSVPSALAMMVRYGDLDSTPLESLRLVLFAGEVFPIPHLRELMRLVPGPRYFNLYGPTETNVCTYHEVTEVPREDDPPVPIGRPCENSRCAVVDEAGEALGDVGSEGELVVTGSIVAQGYWGDEERTAERFREPYTYWTGDIVEILEASPLPQYRFVGRRDHLIKSRGHRIELGEIEAALHSHPAVSECIAVPVPDEVVGNRIVAFCTVEAEADESDLERACKDRVPSYMVPERLILLDSLPRTPNDKYDRPKLAEQAASLIGDQD